MTTIEMIPALFAYVGWFASAGAIAFVLACVIGVIEGNKDIRRSRIKLRDRLNREYGVPIGMQFDTAFESDDCVEVHGDWGFKRFSRVKGN